MTPQTDAETGCQDEHCEPEETSQGTNSSLSTTLEAGEEGSRASTESRASTPVEGLAGTHIHITEAKQEHLLVLST